MTARPLSQTGRNRSDRSEAQPAATVGAAARGAPIAGLGASLVRARRHQRRGARAGTGSQPIGSAGSNGRKPIGSGGGGSEAGRARRRGLRDDLKAGRRASTARWHGMLARSSSRRTRYLTLRCFLDGRGGVPPFCSRSAGPCDSPTGRHEVNSRANRSAACGTEQKRRGIATRT